MKKNSAVLLVNGRSRRGAIWYDAALAGLRARGVNLTYAKKHRDPKKLFRDARRAVDDGEEFLIIGGGDGTLGTVAGYLAYSETTLGVLPLGTGNAFARDLHIPTNVDVACDIIAAGHVLSVDLGRVNNKHFLNVATIGLSTLIAEGLHPDAKKFLGPFAYGLASIRALMDVQPFRVRLHIDGVVHKFSSLQIVIGNGRYHAGPFIIAPEAQSTSGLLEVYALETHHKSELLQFAWAVARGKHGELNNVRVYQVTEGMIETEPVQKVTTDGEIVLKTPIEFGIAPGALRVLAPEE